MTTNQLAYLSYQETARANAAREAEINRSNLVAEEETKRANLAREAVSWEQLGLDQLRHEENVRHNLESEALGRDTLAQTTQHNTASRALKQVELGIEQQKADTAERKRKDELPLNVLGTLGKLFSNIVPYIP